MKDERFPSSPSSVRKNSWSLLSFRSQEVALQQEIVSLRQEIIGVEEREAALRLRLDHLDNELRSAELACYMYTRMRWKPLPGEIPVDDESVDDWCQRFIVFHDSKITFYSRATEPKPQIALTMSEITEFGKIARPASEGKSWFAFHVTTCYGLRLECSTALEHQRDAWLAALSTSCQTGPPE